MSGGLRTRRKSPFVAVPSSTVKDRRLSFKALGILTYLLDKPPGWDVRAESLAGERDPDGRESVLSGLRELARHGYYRLERRRLLSGKFAMGTAVSEDPVATWVEDYEAYDGKPVPLVQQADGSFKVQRPDGSLVDDGFPVDEAPESSDEDVSAGQTGNGFPGSGETESGQPEPGSAGAGEADAKDRTEDTDRDTDPSSLRSEGAAAEASQESLLDEHEPAAQPKPRRRKVPVDWEPDERLLAWAAENAPDVTNLARQTQRFRDHHIARGTLFADVRAGWRTWIGKSQEDAENAAKRGGYRPPRRAYSDADRWDRGGTARPMTAEEMDAAFGVAR